MRNFLSCCSKYRMRQLLLSNSISHLLRGLHSPHFDGSTVVVFGPVPYFLFPRTVGATVEEDKMTFVDGSATLVHIFCRLLQSFPDGFFHVAAEDFQFQNDTLERSTVLFCQWFGDEQVSTATS